MANFRKRRNREHGKRGKSSDWSYPKIEKGSGKQSKYRTARWLQRFKDRLEQYRNDVGL